MESEDFFIKRRIWIPWLLLAQARLTATVFIALFAMTDAQMRGNAAEVMTYMHEFYFESAAMILTLITVGKLLEARSKGKTTDALKGLMGLAPKTATVVRGGEEVKSGSNKCKREICLSFVRGKAFRLTVL